jgi:hypothetical protein
MTSWGITPIITGVAIGSNSSVGIDAAAYGSLRIDGFIIVGSAGGTVALTWSQNTSDAGDVTLLDGSWLALERIA